MLGTFRNRYLETKVLTASGTVNAASSTVSNLNYMDDSGEIKQLNLNALSNVTPEAATHLKSLVAGVVEEVTAGMDLDMTPAQFANLSQADLDAFYEAIAEEMGVELDDLIFS